MPRPLDSRITREVIALREDGADLKTIVKKTGASLSFVSSTLHQHRLEALSGSDIHNRIITLRERKTSISRIAQTLGLKREFVAMVCGSPPERERRPKELGRARRVRCNTSQSLMRIERYASPMSKRF